MATTADEKAAMRADFERLQREYRNMEAMRKAYSEESLGIIKRQRDMIEKLQGDNEQLKAELDLEMRYATKKTVSDTTIAGLHDQSELIGCAVIGAAPRAPRRRHAGACCAMAASFV